MHADHLLKVVGKTINLFDYKNRWQDQKFRIPKKAVLIMPDFIGDVVLLTATVRNLRKNLGDNVVIDVVCNKHAFNILVSLPYINNFYLKDEVKNDKIGFLKGRNYDTMILFNHPVLWAFAGFRVGVAQRVGYSLERVGVDYLSLWQKLITHMIRYTPIYDKKSQREVYLHLLEDLGMQVTDQHPEVLLSQKDLKNADELLKDTKKFKVLIHITAGSVGKQWGIENWFEVIEYLSQNYDCSLIATGSSQDRHLYNYISSKSNIYIHNLCGKTTIREAIAVYGQMDLAVTIDTAQAHLASLAGVKNIVVLYGPTNEHMWKPYAPNSKLEQISVDLPCRPCVTRFCSHKKCLQEIKSSMVIDSIERLLK